MTDYQIVQATGSNTAGQYNCNNVLHPTPDTRYSAKGLGSYLDISLKDKKPIGGISIAFFAGDRRKVKFTVASSDSGNGSDFKLVQTFASSGKTAGAEDFYFDKPVTTQTLRISFAGSFQTGVTFDKASLENFSSDTSSFKCGIGVTGALQDHKGIDDGTVNDWFSVTQVSVLPSKLVESAEKAQEADAKRQEQYQKELEKENAKEHTSDCGCSIHSSSSSSSSSSNSNKKSVSQAKEENIEFQKAGTAGGNAGINKDGQVVSKADANQAKINQSAESNQAVVNKQGASNPTTQNTSSSSSKPAGNETKPSFSLGGVQQGSGKKTVKEGDKLDTTTTVNKKE